MFGAIFRLPLFVLGRGGGVGGGGGVGTWVTYGGVCSMSLHRGNEERDVALPPVLAPPSPVS